MTNGKASHFAVLFLYLENYDFMKISIDHLVVIGAFFCHDGGCVQVASRIKGITVEIGGDTTGLDKALKNVNATIRSTQSSLNDVNKLLKLDPANTELLAQKQKLLKDAIGSTKEKLDALKTAQEQAKQQLENGDLGQDKYDALQREIIETEQVPVVRFQQRICLPVEVPELHQAHQC